MSVQIIVDSTVDMPERMKDRFRIVPLTVQFGAEDFIDGLTIERRAELGCAIPPDVIEQLKQ